MECGRGTYDQAVWTYPKNPFVPDGFQRIDYRDELMKHVCQTQSLRHDVSGDGRHDLELVFIDDTSDYTVLNLARTWP